MVEARKFLRTNETRCGMGPGTHLYTVTKMQARIERNGCQLRRVASTPGISDTFDSDIFIEMGKWDELKELEMEICTTSELQGVGLHLLFIAQKN
ncbi:hypothetical protein GF337_13170 [candidate division KSB1 bacterium]|nr:hypothetical protein [candidate division KSB1 bacterium]